jgi:general secretion pathway protein A
MYEKTFGFATSPFGTEPDPQFFFQSGSHKEAYASLSYGISERRGLMTLVGEVGTGKTVLLKSILQFRDPAAITVFVRNAAVGREELLRKILLDLYSSHGPRSEDDPSDDERTGSMVSRIARLSRVELINEVCTFVMDEFSVYRPAPLFVVDEAQNLSVDALEEVRLLSNLEDSRRNVIQLILSGQPELEKKLMRSDLHRLRRRIAVSVRLERLSLAETSAYINFRLLAAGRPDERLFTAEAAKTIWRASKGTPRTINILCDKALVIAFATGATRVDETAAEAAVRDINSPRYRKVAVTKPGTYLLTGRTSYGQEKDEDAPPVDQGDRRSRAG